MSNDIRKNNTAAKDRAADWGASEVLEDFNNDHCMGVKWSAVYKVAACREGIKISYSSHSVSGSVTYRMRSFDPTKKPSEDQKEQSHRKALKVRDIIIGKMIELMSNSDKYRGE